MTAETATAVFDAPEPAPEKRRARSRERKMGWRSLLGVGWLADCLAVAGGFILPPAASTPPNASAIKPLPTRVIETIQVGERVAAFNPELTEEEHARPEPDWTTWKKVSLRFGRHSDTSDITLLRPADWCATQEVTGGSCVRLHLPEIGIDGLADVLSVENNPRIEPGSGRVVTATYRHAVADRLVEVATEGESAPIGCTAGHPFWSEDRQAFVSADSLQAGERLQTPAGAFRTVTSVRQRPGGEAVYNLEVDGEHTYYVTATGLLVHNVTPGCGATPIVEKRGSRQILAGFKTASGKKLPTKDTFNLTKQWLQQGGKRDVTVNSRDAAERLRQAIAPSAKPLRKGYQSDTPPPNSYQTHPAEPGAGNPLPHFKIILPNGDSVHIFFPG